MPTLPRDTSPRCANCGHTEARHVPATHRQPGKPACKGAAWPCSCSGYVAVTPEEEQTTREVREADQYQRESLYQQGKRDGADITLRLIREVGLEAATQIVTSPNFGGAPDPLLKAAGGTAVQDAPPSSRVLPVDGAGAPPPSSRAPARRPAHKVICKPGDTVVRSLPITGEAA